MNSIPNTIGQRRIAREDCEVGDWVDAIIAPEWLEQQSSYMFRRKQISISPVDGSMGGVLPEQYEEWTFVADRRSNGLTWVRKS
jgi:hypothetical protein